MPDVASEIKNIYVGWCEGPRLANVHQYARHPQNQVETRNTTKRDTTEKELHLAAMTMYHAVGDHPGNRGQGRGRGRRRGGRHGPRLIYDPNVCFYCGQTRLWKKDCPQLRSDDIR